MAFVLQPAVTADGITLQSSAGVLSVKTGALPYKLPFAGSVRNSALPNAVNRFHPVNGTGVNGADDTNYGTEARVRIPAPATGTIKEFALVVNDAVAATTTVTAALRKNTADGLTGTYADTDAAGTVIPVAGTLAVTKGDLIDVRASHNNAAARIVTFGWSFYIEVSAP